MNRRLFLSSLAALASTAVLDPEKLLWIPGNKAISIPSRRVAYAPIEIDVILGVDFEFSEDELILSMDDFRERYIAPAIKAYVETRWLVEGISERAFLRKFAELS